MARLIFQLGDGKTVDFNLSAAVVTLGRSTSNDIVINNGWISSHHAKFERSGGAIEVTSLGSLHGIPLKEYKRVGGVYTVVDLDSHNGVMVNGARVATKELKSGDRLAFGQLEAHFEDTATTSEPAADEPPSTPSTPDAAATATDPPVPPDIPLFVSPNRPRPVTQHLVKPSEPSPVVPGPPPPVPAPRAPSPTAASAPLKPPPIPKTAPEAKAEAPPAPKAQLGLEPATKPVGENADGALPPPAPPTPVAAVAAPAAPTAPTAAKSALASIQRDVALLEQTLGALQNGTAAYSESDQALAKGLIQRIDLLEDLMTAGERALPGLAAQLRPLHASLLELLREHSIETYTIHPGQALDVATRKRITIVEAAPEGEGITEIAEVFRPGYHYTHGSGDLPAVVLRKAEVRTLRRPLGQVT